MTYQQSRKEKQNIPPQLPKERQRWQQPSQTMVHEAKQNGAQIIKKLFDYLNKNDLNALHFCDELFSSNVQIHDVAYPHFKSGTQALRQCESEYIRAFPDKKAKIDKIFTNDDGNTITVCWTCTGNQKGPFKNISPKNKPFKISGITVYCCDNDKISEVWQNWDIYGLIEQVK